LKDNWFASSHRSEHENKSTVNSLKLQTSATLRLDSYGNQGHRVWRKEKGKLLGGMDERASLGGTWAGSFEMSNCRMRGINSVVFIIFLTAVQLSVGSPKTLF
jgi:hypothetical protein